MLFAGWRPAPDGLRRRFENPANRCPVTRRPVLQNPDERIDVLFVLGRERRFRWWRQYDCSPSGTEFPQELFDDRLERGIERCGCSRGRKPDVVEQADGQIFLFVLSHLEV